MKEFDIEKLLNKRTSTYHGAYWLRETEVAINLAIKLNDKGHRVELFDMDLVKPYIRIRDIEEKLINYGFDMVLPPP